MDGFISEKTEVRERLSGHELSVSLPDAAAWEEKRAAFRTERKESGTPVTVGAEVPVEPYGEELGAARKFLRRCLRRCLRWYAEPLIARQNAVNRSLLARIEELEEEVRRMKETERE